MDMISFRRNQTQWNINQNPTEIIISRTEKIEIEGHFENSKNEVGPFKVRIFQKKQGTTKDESNLGGTKKTDTNWGLIADYMADIKSGPNVVDEFEIPVLGHFKITGIMPQVVSGQIVSFQVDLEKVM